jgi:ribosomal protein S18 acetylase RimI-like enzyme
MRESDLAWAVEEACQNAWPSPRQVILRGWLLRAAGGPVRRTNSVNPLRGGPRDPSGVIAAAEDVYSALGQSAIFRVPSIVTEMDAPLHRHGYLPQAETSTQYCDLDNHHSIDQQSVKRSEAPGQDWLAARSLFDNRPGDTDTAFREMVANIILPKSFVARREGAAIVSIAYGVLCDGLLVVESVATHPGHRQRGHAARTVSVLMDWAVANGASVACLQLMTDNEPALAFYRSLGFARELYRYHYACKAVAG